jgi:hypothetical protein
MSPYVHVKELHTAAHGKHVRIDLSHDVYRALVAAVNVAFEDVDTIPAEYADGANALWQSLVADIHASA